MKNSTKTYLLLFAVLGIWGTIAFKAIAGLRPNAPLAKEVGSANVFKPKENLEMDTFSIRKVERDPFLGSFNTSNKKRTKAKKSIKKKVKKAPSIQFIGLIKNQKADKEIFIVKIKQEQYLLKLGETVEGVKLISGNPKNIIVSCENIKHTIPRV